jgi:superfamily II DNA helicase RecQ
VDVEVNEAQKKGLKAVMVNEDTVGPEIWANLRQGRANLYYVSPEMALSTAFIQARRAGTSRACSEPRGVGDFLTYLPLPQSCH